MAQTKIDRQGRPAAADALDRPSSSDRASSSGVPFPPPPAGSMSAALLSTSTAPAWVDSEVCLRCRTAFSFTNRKHHCRNCGKVFDQSCSSHSMALPHFGIAEEVRVCDGCWAKSKTGGLAKQSVQSGVASPSPTGTLG